VNPIVDESIPHKSWTSAGSQTDGCITAVQFLGTSARAALCTRVNLHRRSPSVFMRINKSLVQRRELYIDCLV